MFRRRITGLGLLALTLVMLSLAAAFGFLGFYLWLLTLMPAWYAALLVTGMAVFLSLVLWLLGRTLLRRHQPRTKIITDEVQSFMGEFSHGTGGDNRKKTLELIATAAIVGLILGRLLPK